jgi:DNA mismatch repair protein MutS
MIDDLPLFSHRPATSDRKEPLREAEDPLREALAAIEPDALTPREALAVLYELKEKAKF